MNSSAPNEWTAQLKRGVLELVILKKLSLQPTYGYALIADLAALGPLAVGENTIYPLLRRLSRDGLLESFEMPSTAGPQRRHLRLTELGQRRLAALQREWDAMTLAVRSISETPA